jgi:uncharacterized protein (TIGR03000 family)
MRYITMVVLGFAIIIPSTASAGCFDRCRGHQSSCYGCQGCYGSHSCFGYYGCSGLSRCYGCYGSSCYGCYGSRGCHGCYGTSGCYGTNSCCGCTGGTVWQSNAAGVTNIRTSSYYDSSATSANQVRVKVLLPDSEASLYIQGQKMNLTGNERFFFSPDLEAGKSFTYTIKMQRVVSGKTVDETRSIDVQAGDHVLVDFTRASTVITLIVNEVK